jgi:hypothetical protein
VVFLLKSKYVERLFLGSLSKGIAGLTEEFKEK